MSPRRSPAVRRCQLLGWASLALVGCAQLRPPAPPPAAGHLAALPRAADPIPAIVAPTSFVPPPQTAARSARYTVVVNAVPVRELLFALARDAAVNLDVPGDLEGQVTLNAIDQTLPQILERVARQVNLRYAIQGDTVSVVRDDPYFQTYEVGYVNLSRDTETTVNIATQVATTGEGGV